MAKSVNCFIPYRDKAQVTETINGLRGIEIVDRIYLLATDKNAEAYPGYEMIQIDSLKSTETVKKIAAKSDSDYSLIYTKESTLVMGMFALERMVGLGNDTGAAMLYADHYQIVDEKRNISPVITYQQGSLRDDFNFGSVLLYKSAAIKEAAARMTVGYKVAGLYDLRLKASQKASLEHVNEYMYTEVENDTRKSGEKIFDYVDPKNRAVQIEMEEACTDHLKAIGGYL